MELAHFAFFDYFKKHTVKSGETIGEILYANHIDYPAINTIVNKSKEIFDVRSINAGKNYTIIQAADSTEKVKYFIYEIDVTNYIVFDLRNKIDVYKSITNKEYGLTTNAYNWWWIIHNSLF